MARNFKSCFFSPPSRLTIEQCEGQKNSKQTSRSLSVPDPTSLASAPSQKHKPIITVGSSHSVCLRDKWAKMITQSSCIMGEGTTQMQADSYFLKCSYMSAIHSICTVTVSNLYPEEVIRFEFATKVFHTLEKTGLFKPSA